MFDSYAIEIFIKILTKCTMDHRHVTTILQLSGSFERRDIMPFCLPRSSYNNPTIQENLNTNFGTKQDCGID
jgi:hypothetical protein